MSQIIVGAGLAGLIAACHFKSARIIDASSGPTDTHQALLRFRNTSVSEVTGIPFKQVTVTKAVHIDGKTKDSCTVREANQYSIKVSGGVRRRSITNLQPDVRYIAPDDFYAQLIERHRSRIDFNTPLSRDMLATMRGIDFISTAPMSVNLAAAGIDHGGAFSFDKSSIGVFRVKLKIKSDIYQTIYFPDPYMKVFRASITGDVLIVESISTYLDHSEMMGELDIVLDAFGLPIEQLALDLSTAQSSTQPYGKIVDMEKGLREAFMHELTTAHRVFSLGRFATWRNILLDDVVNDIASIDRLVKASEYSRKLILANQK